MANLLEVANSSNVQTGWPQEIHMSNSDFDVVTGPSVPPGRLLAALSRRLPAAPGAPAALPDADAGAAPGRLALAPLQPLDTLPQPSTVPPIFRDETLSPG
jgi:hypothetical protein